MLNKILEKFPAISGEILVDEESLKKYSRDASLFEVKPQAVIFPKNVEDIKSLVKHKIILTPRSAGTDMTGGDLTENAVLDFTKHFNRIKEIGKDYAVVQPGVFYRDFEKETLKHNLLLPSYPASREICAVGGMVANNSGGEKTLAYGKTEDYILELKAVFSDGNEYLVKPLNPAELSEKLKQNNFEGELYRKIYNLVSENNAILKAAKPKVSKNSAGYYLWNVWDGRTFDLTKLLVGSQGTLGIITEIKFRLIHPKQYSKLMVIFLKDLSSLVKVVETAMEFKPESFESFDDHTLKLAIRFFPGFLKLMGVNLFKLAIQFLPEFWLLLTGGLPKLILLAEFVGDNESELIKKLSELSNGLDKLKIKNRIIKNESEARKYWTIRHESFNLLRQHIRGKRTAPFIDDFIVPVEKLADFLPQLDRLLSQYDFIYTIAGHVGDGNFHIIPLMDLNDPNSKDIIRKLSNEAYDLVLKFGGSITAEHNDGLIRSPFLKKMYGDKIYSLFEETKKIFDPENIFNPGKKTGSSLAYALDRLIKDS